MEILDKMFKETNELRVGDATYLFPFQRYILISINALKGLYAVMKLSNMPVTYILTHRLNQDVLENSFSVIRSIGGHNDTPNAEDAKNRIKILMLGWNFGRNKSTPVQKEQPKLPCVSYKLLDRLFTTDETVENVQIENNELEHFEVDVVETIDESNYTETVESMSKTEQASFWGKEFVAGFIAFKMKKRFPDLNLVQQNPNREPKSFTENLSRGFLSVPSYDLLNEFLKFEEVFLYFFKDFGDENGIFIGEDCMKKLCIKLESEVIKLYVRTRVFIRIKNVNTSIKQKKYQKNPKLHHYLRSRVIRPQTSAASAPVSNTEQQTDVFATDDQFFKSLPEDYLMDTA